MKTELPKRICIISQREVVNTVGGAITIFINLSNMLQKKGYDVTAMCFADENNRPKNLLQEVNFVNLNYCYNKKYKFSKAINTYLKAHPQDLLIFFFPDLYINAKLCSELSNIPKLLMFHSRPDIYFQFDKKLKNKLEKSYKNTNAMVLLPSFVGLLPDFLKKNQVFVIGNPIQQQNYAKDDSIEYKKIIYLTRFDRFKGLKLLIDSFAKVVKIHPDWQLDLYGQFQPIEFKYYIQDKIEELGLSQFVNIKGITNTPLEIYKNYDFAVCPSEIEGFGIGLAEALSMGLPCVGLKGCSAVNELIIDNQNGFLCDKNTEEFANKINVLIENKKLRSEFSKVAVKSIAQYSPEIIDNKWIEVVDTLLSNKNLNSVNLYTNVKSSHKIFDLDEIISLKSKGLSFWEYIFSIKTSEHLSHVDIRIFGIKFSYKRCKKRH